MQIYVNEISCLHRVSCLRQHHFPAQSFVLLNGESVVGFFLKLSVFALSIGSVFSLS